MKKLSILFLALLSSTCTLFAEVVSIGNLSYNLDTSNQTAEVTSTSIEFGNINLVIPRSVTYDSKTYSVTSIGHHAFSKCAHLASIEIPNSVTIIGSGAFYSCSGLTSITIPNSVTSIEYSTFEYCTGLTSINIPSSVTSIGDRAFFGCSKLTSIAIPNSVASIGNQAFGRCTGLNSPVYNAHVFAYIPTSYTGAYTIPDGIEAIAGSAFSDCTGLTSVKISNNVTSIGNFAFDNCSGLTSVAIPNSVTSIGDGAFRDCTGLTSPVYNAHIFAFIPTSYNGAYTIPNGIKSIAGYAFYKCTGLTSVTIPNSITSIGGYAFFRCTGLTSITIPSSVTSIGNSAFYGCTGMTSITIPSSVTSIGNSAFYGCTGMPIIDNIRYADTYLIEAVDKTLSTYTIKEGTKWIGDYAFYGCTGLTSITIPSSVTSIGEVAFRDCTGLTSVIIPDNVTSIGNSAFRDCTSLTSVTIPNSIISIEYGAFYGCTGLTDIYVTCGDLDRVKQLLDNDCRVKYMPYPAYSITKVGDNGTITKTTSPTTICDEPYVTFTAQPNTGYHFSKWSDGDINNPRTVQLTQDTSFTAEFAINKYSIQAVSGNTSMGRAAGSTIAEHFENISLTATPLYGYHFSYWESDGKKYYTNPLTVSVSKEATYTAYFQPNNYKVGASCNTTQGKVSAPTTATYLETISVTASANYGYHFAQWSDGSKENPREVLIVQDTTFTAEFAMNQYSVQAISENNVKGSTSGSTVADYMNNVEIAAIPQYGYHFAYWMSDSEKFYDNPLSVTVRSDVAYTAYFDLNTYIIDTHTNPVQGLISAPAEAKYMEQITITATANKGYHFSKWSDGDINNPRTIQLTQDTSFTAEFAKNTYTITTVSNNLEYGYTYGGGQAEYKDAIELTAVPQVGHHFSYWQCGSSYYTNNPVTVVVLEDATYTALFGIDTYYLDVNANPSQGYVTAPSQAEFLKEVKMTATPLNGYVFTQWSDGDTSNPRTVQLTQDTSFTAEFAKAKYTITSSVNDEEGGSVIGDAEVEYLTSVTLTATANYGYHFDHWEAGSKTYSSNPLTVTVTGSAAYKAFFARNTYSISANSNNTSWGSVTAPTQAEYMRSVTLAANPSDGCHFVQWNDGETDNPRKVKITQDTTFTAEFAITTSGSCGDNLTWSYRNNKLTISGSGGMYTYTATTAPWRLLVSDIYSVVIPEGLTDISSNAFDNCQNLTYVIWNAVNCTAPSDEASAPFYAIRTKIRSFTFGESVKKVPAYLCYEMSALTSITLGSNVTNIGKHAFEGCEDLASITCEASIPPTCGTDAFTGVSIFIPVHVPHLSLEKYAKAPIWKEFDAFSSIQAENKPVSDVTVTPSENSVVIEWPAATGAEVYTLVIERNGVPFCILSFNAQGQLLGISFAPSRNGAHKSQTATQTATGWQFTVTSLDSGTTYDYLVTAKKADDTPVYSKSGTFTTTGVATSTDQITNDQSPITNKVIRDGQILILRGDRTYTLTGAEVK